MSCLGFICERVLATMHILLVFMNLSILAETTQPVRSMPEDALFPTRSPIYGKQCLRHDPAQVYRPVYSFQSPVEEPVYLEQSIKSSPGNLETRLESLTNFLDLELDQNQLTGNIATKLNISTTQEGNIAKSNWTSVAMTMEVEALGLLSAFTPYSSKVPWKTGIRRFVSRLFPRYGHYCGPSWSSGRETGSLVWDKAPIDSLDFCCFQHDVGFDSHEQADLHRADLSFLNCLEKIPREGRKAGDHPVSELNRNAYIFVLKRVLIPYRKFLLQNVDEATRKKFTEIEISRKHRSIEHSL